MNTGSGPRRWLVAAAMPIAAGACGPAATSGGQLVVFAAASLAAPFAELEAAFEARHPGIDVQCNLAGTPQLVLQIGSGARADVFAAADMVHMQRLVADGQTVGEPIVFARNRLAIVVAAGNPRGITGLADLARGDLAIALCGPDVPAGRYARQALASAGITVRSRSDEPNVKALVAKVRLGELDAGIVYATDTRAGGVAGVAIAAPHHVLADYPVAICKNGGNGAAGAEFVAFVRSADGQRILERSGFLPP